MSPVNWVLSTPPRVNDPPGSMTVAEPSLSNLERLKPISGEDQAPPDARVCQKGVACEAARPVHARPMSPDVLALRRPEVSCVTRSGVTVIILLLLYYIRTH